MKNTRLNILIRSSAAIFIVIFMVILLLECKIRSENQTYELSADAIIILGARVRGMEPSLSLISRMDAAVVAAQYSPKAKLVLSGGQGQGEIVSEAQAMFTYLKLKGINSNRLVLESNSYNTLQNLSNSKALFGGINQWLIITNDYHAYRACMFAKQLNMNAICHGALTPQHVALKLRVREYAAILYYWFF